MIALRFSHNIGICLISAAMVLCPLTALCADSSKFPSCSDCSALQVVSMVRTNCSYMGKDGRCEKTCPTGSLFMEVPNGAFACVKVAND